MTEDFWPLVSRSGRSSRRGRAPRMAAVASMLLAAALPATAQYKVIAPDGRITYTDRPPLQGRVTTVNAARGPSTGASAAVDATLPIELRQPVARYPVTLYTMTGACDPCGAARQLLRTRGVPFSEKQVLSSEDAEALERLTGARDAPTLAIGSQMLRGLAPEVWGSYLDAAGYPRESRLPPGFPFAAPTSIVERREAGAGANGARQRPAGAAGAVDPAAAAAAADLPPAAPAGTQPGAIRF